MAAASRCFSAGVTIQPWWSAYGITPGCRGGAAPASGVRRRQSTTAEATATPDPKSEKSARREIPDGVGVVMSASGP